MTANIARDWRNDPLDRNIVPLVNALTELGFETRSSCHGHCRNFALPPYVTFESAVVDAASISRILRDDAESGRPRLYWGWRVDAGFDDAHRLYFRITTDNPGLFNAKSCQAVPTRLALTSRAFDERP
jgi:hypothetical protein